MVIPQLFAIHGWIIHITDRLRGAHTYGIFVLLARY
nr:MAG TPA: hypothetical protein [Caudoviricetes sp.]